MPGSKYARRLLCHSECGPARSTTKFACLCVYRQQDSTIMWTGSSVASDLRPSTKSRGCNDEGCTAYCYGNQGFCGKANLRSGRIGALQVIYQECRSEQHTVNRVANTVRLHCYSGLWKMPVALLMQQAATSSTGRGVPSEQCQANLPFGLLPPVLTRSTIAQRHSC